MGLLVSAAFAGDAGARDPETRMAPLMYTSPVEERTYVAGRCIRSLPDECCGAAGVSDRGAGWDTTI